MEDKTTPIIFTELDKLIPANGSINMTAKKNSDGTLGVIIKTNHNLSAKPSSHSNEKELKGTVEAIEHSTKVLEKVISFAGKPEDLTANFGELMNKRAAAAKTLEEAIAASITELNEALKDLKAKKLPAKTGKTAAKTAPKTIEGKKEEKMVETATVAAAAPGLFGDPLPEPVAEAASAEGVSKAEKADDISKESKGMKEEAA